MDFIFKHKQNTFFCGFNIYNELQGKEDLWNSWKKKKRFYVFEI